MNQYIITHNNQIRNILFLYVKLKKTEEQRELKKQTRQPTFTYLNLNSLL